MYAAYPIWLLVFFLVPVLLLWVFAYKYLRPYRSVFVKIASLCMVIGSLWDVFAVRTGIWMWPLTCCVLPRFYSIPLEELGFMFLGGLYIASLTIIVRDILKVHVRLRKGKP